MNDQKTINQKLDVPRQTISTEHVQQIEEFAKSIRYGSITLVFQDGDLIQIEKNEKIRIPSK